MTYRYYNIRREICNDNSEKELKRFRSFNELKELYKPFHWIVFVAMLISLLAFMILSIFITNKLWCSLPLLAIVIFTNLWESKAEKLYNTNVRQNELKSIKDEYEKYLGNISKILKGNGITSKEQLDVLIEECQSVFTKRENRFKILGSKIFELFIGVPIGALISTLMYKNTDAIPTQIVAVLFIGMFIYVIIAAAKFVTYYTDGLWKDQQLLDSLKEMEYYFVSSESEENDEETEENIKKSTQD